MRDEIQKSRPNLFRYTDYRDFVKDFYEYKKAANRKYSLGVLSKKVGVSKTAVKLLIDGKRHIANDRVSTLVEALCLDNSSIKYFDSLVQFNKSKNQKDKDKYFERMMENKCSQLNETILTDEESALFREWYFPVILEMSYLEGFEWDASWISKHLRFKVETKKIESCIPFIKKFREKHEDVKLRLPEEFKSYLYLRYCIQLTRQAEFALTHTNSDERYFSNLTISVDEETYLKAKKRLKKFSQEIHDLLAGSSKCERVIQVNLQLYQPTLATIADNPETINEKQQKLANL